jgi:hypothetical protein
MYNYYIYIDKKDFSGRAIFIFALEDGTFIFTERDKNPRGGSMEWFGIFQLFSLLITIVFLYALVSLIGYINWKKKHDAEVGKKLEHIIDLLSNKDNT